MGQRSRSTKPAAEQSAMGAGAGQSQFGDYAEPDSKACESRDEIAMVRKATEVLGIGHVARWMRSEIPSLGNRTPYTLIKSQDGRNQVERVLTKIEHGVY
jgi:hypothetical protein